MLRKYSKLFIAIVWAVAAFTSCDNNSAIVEPPFNGGENASVRLSALGDCQNEQGTTLANIERHDELQATVQDGKVSFTHTRALYNCCMDSISLDIEANGEIIRVVETEHCKSPCFCICEYAVYGEILDLEPDSYTIQIFSELNSEEMLCSVMVKIN